MYRIAVYDALGNTQVQVCERETAMTIANEFVEGRAFEVSVYNNDELIWQAIPN